MMAQFFSSGQPAYAASKKLLPSLLMAVVMSMNPLVVSRVVAQPVPNDSLVRRALTADTVIDGIPCARSAKAKAEFHLNKRLAGCALSRAHTMGAHPFPTGTWVNINASGVLWGAWLARDVTLAGHLCRGDGYKAWSVRFHPNGALEGCYLKLDAVVEGVPCMRGTFLRELRGSGRTALQLYDDGHLRQCLLARDTVIAGRALKKWEVFARPRSSATVPGVSPTR